MPDLYIDIDARTLYSQVLPIAQRRDVDLYVVTRDYLSVDETVHLILLDDSQKNGGAWIAANISPGDICVSGDSKVAASCILRGAIVLSPAGRQWLPDPVDHGLQVRSGYAPESRMLDRLAFIRRLETAIIESRSSAAKPLPTPLLQRRRA
jgi:uncharacterized protein